jgi:hypothetical protein
VRFAGKRFRGGLLLARADSALFFAAGFLRCTPRRALWERVRQQLKLDTRRGPRHGKVDALLSDLLYCVQCGERMREKQVEMSAKNVRPAAWIRYCWNETSAPHIAYVECSNTPTSFQLLPKSSTLNSNRRKKRFLRAEPERPCK